MIIIFIITVSVEAHLNDTNEHLSIDGGYFTYFHVCFR